MALTKVSGSIIKDSVSLSGNVSVGGTLTYQDVTNVDAVGIVTARTGLKVLAGGANIVGVVTATQFKGDGSQLTGISAGVSLANGADNRVVTATGAAALNGESGLTFDGSQLVIETSAQNNLKINSSNSDGPNIHFERSGTAFAYLGSAAANTGGTATDLALRAQGNLLFATNGGTERLRLTSGGVLTFPTAGIGLHNSSTNSYFFASGSNETRIYHSANAQIKLSFHGSGDTLRGAVSADASGMHILTAGSGEQKGVRCITDGTTELYYSGSKKFETTSTGIKVNNRTEIKPGAILDNTANGNNMGITFNGDGIRPCNGSGTEVTNTYDLGNSQYRWRNVYTQDLQLSNEAVEGGNDIDNTWGDYTIQEGESDLFLINNRSGKKYKFNLTEVS